MDQDSLTSMCEKQIKIKVSTQWTIANVAIKREINSGKDLFSLVLKMSHGLIYEDFRIAEQGEISFERLAKKCLLSNCNKQGSMNVR